jgi:hypothetical protein
MSLKISKLNASQELGIKTSADFAISLLVGVVSLLFETQSAAITVASDILWS